MQGLTLESRRGASPRPASSSRIPSPKTRAKILTAQPIEVPVTTTLPAPNQPLRPCLKPARQRTVPVKTARFIEYGGWNLHDFRPFDPEEPANVFIPVEDAEISQPTCGGPATYQTVEGMSGVEIRWPDPDTPKEELEDKPPGKSYWKCHWCVNLANMGRIPTSHQMNMPTVLCESCMLEPEVRKVRWSPALDYNGEDDHLDEEAQGKRCELRIAKHHAAKFPMVKKSPPTLFTRVRARVARVSQALMKEKRNTTQFYRSWPRQKIHQVRQKLAWRFT